jgi:hypothetical protein
MMRFNAVAFLLQGHGHPAIEASAFVWKPRSVISEDQGMQILF